MEIIIIILHGWKVQQARKKCVGANRERKINRSSTGRGHKQARWIRGGATDECISVTRGEKGEEKAICVSVQRRRRGGK